MSAIHQHHSHTNTKNEKKVFLAFTLTFSFMVIEVLGGIFSGSLTLLADSGHMLTDALSLLFAYLAFRIGRTAPDNKHTYGRSRFEVLAGFLNALGLFLISIWILYEAWQRFYSSPEILAGPMSIIAVIGLLVNILVLWIMTRGETENINIKGAILHVMGDLLGSIGAIIAAIIIHLTGWTYIDPIISILVTLLILRSAWRLLVISTNILLEGTPDNISLSEIKDYLLENIDVVAEIDHVHVWQLTSGQIMATLHIRPTVDSEAQRADLLAQKALAEHFEIYHATIAIDWNEKLDIPNHYNNHTNF